MAAAGRAGATVVDPPMSHPASSPTFWQQRWEAGQTAFHEGKPNSHLQQWWPTLALAPGSRVLVPLCGKSADLSWLAGQGHEVVGVELTEIACAAFFAEHQLVPERSKEGPFTAWRAGAITILQGDVFGLGDASGRDRGPGSEAAPDADRYGGFHAAWDRAALIALPPDVRPRYAALVQGRLGRCAPTLLVTMAYDTSKRDGPPFSVPEEEVRRLYPSAVLLGRGDLSGEERWAGMGASETVWRA